MAWVIRGAGDCRTKVVLTTKEEVARSRDRGGCKCGLPGYVCTPCRTVTTLNGEVRPDHA